MRTRRALLLALALLAAPGCGRKPEPAPGAPAEKPGDSEVLRGAQPPGQDARLHGAANYAPAERKPLVVAGIVRDAATSRSVPYAALRLVSTEPDGRSYAVQTDGSGKFRFPEVPPGSYALEVSAPGFAPHRDWLALASDGETVELPIDIEPEEVPRGYQHFRPPPPTP